MGGLAVSALSPFPALAAGRDQELNILVWEGYNGDKVLEPCREEFNIKDSAATVISDPDAVNKLRAGETKMAHPVKAYFAS